MRKIWKVLWAEKGADTLFLIVLSKKHNSIKFLEDLKVDFRKKKLSRAQDLVPYEVFFFLKINF